MLPPVPVLCLIHHAALRDACEEPGVKNALCHVADLAIVHASVVVDPGTRTVVVVVVSATPVGIIWSFHFAFLDIVNGIDHNSHTANSMDSIHSNRDSRTNDLAWGHNSHRDDDIDNVYNCGDNTISFLAPLCLELSPSGKLPPGVGPPLSVVFHEIKLLHLLLPKLIEHNRFLLNCPPIAI